MPADPRPASRSRTEWMVRGVLAAMIAIVGCISVTFSLAWSLASNDPALAHRLAPYDGQLTGRAAIALATLDVADGSVSMRGDVLARRALRQDANAVAAVATLGMNAEMRGDVATARRFFAYAQKLTRRDRRTQLWAIEDAVRRNDIPGAVMQYDIALRTMPGLAEVLFPVLGSASADDRIRAALVRTLGKGPIWRTDFVDYVAKDKNVDPVTAVSLLVALHHARIAVAPAVQGQIINALLASGKIDVAWNYYAMIHPGIVRTRSRDPRFAGAGEIPSQFDWVPVGDDRITTGISGGVFDFAVSAGVGGALLRQLQLLSPGTYRLTGQTSGIDQAPDSRPYWVLACQDGRELGRVPLPNSSDGDGRFAGTLSVPAGCPMQTLSLIARPSDSIGGYTGQIRHAELTRSH